ncbi:MAG: helicase C-terminal domain-containing protein [archaeon]
MTWSLYSKTGKNLPPLKFSNGKSQEDVVNEVLEAISQGHKIIFIHGICGTGKSAIALNIAKKLGKASIVVPIKNLQEQYKKDYEGNMYLLKNNGEKLNISVITGRNNHKCKFLEDAKNLIPKETKEVNSKLHDIFEGKREELLEKARKDFSADNPDLPCKIELKEKNWNKIKKYLKQNKRININNFTDIKDVKRIPIASVCPYWSPVVPEEYELKVFEKAKKKTYLGLNNIKFTFYQRKTGCKFYEQFNFFVDSDVIVFNSLKYKLESLLNRKPATEVEIIDECDEFLDSFANQRTINIERLQNSLVHVLSLDEKVEEIVREINAIIKQIKKNYKDKDPFESEKIIPLKATGIYDLLRIFLNSPEFLDEVDEESYLFKVEETARMFEGFFNESYVTFDKRENNLVASIVTTNLAKKFQEMVDKNKIIILMSGTIHSENVLRDIFGLEDYKIIEAETGSQGSIKIQRTGLEMDCRYSKLNSGGSIREKYLKALDKCVETAKKPVLVHVGAFIDIPTRKEIKEFNLFNLIGRDKLRDLQDNDKKGKFIQEFKGGGFDILFTTRCSRGIDFPGEQCNSIIFTKYPNPNVQDAFWKILAKTKPQYYWDFYKDKAKRELWQKVYRGLRFKEDKVTVLSPDVRVIESFEDN